MFISNVFPELEKLQAYWIKNTSWHEFHSTEDLKAMVVIWNYLPALDWLNYFLIIKSLDVSNLPNALTNQIAQVPPFDIFLDLWPEKISILGRNFKLSRHRTYK